MENLMIETESVNLFDRMRPAYQKWAEPVSRFFARTVLEHADLNPGARVLDVCASAGHWLPLERTKEVNAALLDLLRGLDT
jgi:pimeloyl-ACP methyl ester carboxylesterase